MKTVTQQDYYERILRVLVHIQAHLDDPLDLDDLAALACFSPYHFHRIFRGVVGEPLKEHIRRLRLERAAYQLKTTDRAITHIAFDAGYDAHEAFTRRFKAQFNSSPADFRKQHALHDWGSSSGVHYVADGQLDFTPQENDMDTLEVNIVHRDPERVMFMRHVGPYDQVGNTWQALMGFAASKRMFGTMARPLAIVHDDPDVTSPDKLRYDVCLVVGENFRPEGQIGVQEIAGGDYAVGLHKGPYDQLGKTYAAVLGQWLPAHDRTPALKPCLEVYLNNPQDTPPADLLTEVHVPLA